MRYSIEPRDQIHVKGYGFLSFAKNMSKNIDISISKNLSGKYSEKVLDHAKQCAIDGISCFKIVSKRVIH